MIQYQDHNNSGGPTINVGVVAIQGDFDEHIVHFNSISGCKAHPIRNVTDLLIRDYNALVFPGGESTTYRRVFSNDKDLYNGLKDMIQCKKVPVWGTCCGLILLAKNVDGVPAKSTENAFPCLDVDVCRNAYGSQNDSFCRTLKVELSHNEQVNFEGIFIRSPAIRSIGKNVKVVASIEGTHEYPIVGVSEGNVFATCFHPELSDQNVIHKYFIEFAQKYVGEKGPAIN